MGLNNFTKQTRILPIQFIVRLVKFAAACILMLSSTLSFAEVIDGVEVVERDQRAIINIKFSQKIIYLRHVVTHDRKSVRVFFRLVGASQSEVEINQEIVKSSRTKNFAGVSVIYPELINAMLVNFNEAVEASVRAGSDGRSVIISVPFRANNEINNLDLQPERNPNEKASEPIIDKSSQVTVDDTGVSNENAKLQNRVLLLKADADKAIAEKDYTKAIGRLNLILSMPVNESTEDAQALIGELREASGENIKAKAEYDLYLKLFPEGRHASKVKKKLLALPRENRNQQIQQSRLPTEAGAAEWTSYGNLSGYYYSGKSQIEMLTPTAPGQLTFNRDTLSLIDQNSLISSLNLNVRRRDGFTDTRFVIRDTDNHNFLNANRSYNRLYAAYVEHTSRKLGYYFRAGRQNPNGMGVLDRFDGLQAGLNFAGVYKGNVVYGKAVEFGSPFKKDFYGVSIDRQAQTGVPGVSAYAIEQTLDGFANRRAFGTELRYFDGKSTVYSMLDYDVLYKGINIALVQGNYLAENGANWFFVYDHRRAPGYSLTNALQAVPGMKLSEMIMSQGLSQVRGHAVALTAMSDMLSIGVNRQFFEKWQLGVDYRLSSISSTQPVMAVLPLAVIGTCLGRIDSLNNTCIIDTLSQQASGKNHVVTFQAVATNLWKENAVGVGNVSLIKAPNYNGQAYSFAYAIPVGQASKLDGNFRYYTQKDIENSTQSRVNYSLKYSFQWSDSLFLEGELGRESAKTNGGLRNDNSTRDYIFLGLRSDFR